MSHAQRRPVRVPAGQYMPLYHYNAVAGMHYSARMPALQAQTAAATGLRIGAGSSSRAAASSCNAISSTGKSSNAPRPACGFDRSSSRCRTASIAVSYSGPRRCERKGRTREWNVANANRAPCETKKSQVGGTRDFEQVHARDDWRRPP